MVNGMFLSGGAYFLFFLEYSMEKKLFAVVITEGNQYSVVPNVWLHGDPTHGFSVFWPSKTSHPKMLLDKTMKTCPLPDETFDLWPCEIVQKNIGT